MVAAAGAWEAVEAPEDAAGVLVGSDIVVVVSYRVRRGGGGGKLFSEARRGSGVA